MARAALAQIAFIGFGEVAQMVANGSKQAGGAARIRAHARQRSAA